MEEQVNEAIAEDIKEALAEEQAEPQAEKDIQKIYIKNYGNLVLEILGTNDVGVAAFSAKRNETLFIPWNSVIMISKVDNERED